MQHVGGGDWGVCGHDRGHAGWERMNNTSVRDAIRATGQTIFTDVMDIARGRVIGRWVAACTSGIDALRATDGESFEFVW